MKNKSTKASGSARSLRMSLSKLGKETRSADEIELGNRLYAIRKQYGDVPSFLQSDKAGRVIVCESERAVKRRSEF